MKNLHIPIVDCHLHLWDPKLIRYPWLDKNEFLNRPFLLEDFREACGWVEVGKMVFVQCEADPAEYLAEAAWVSRLAEVDRRIQGIIPWAPLEKGDAVQGELELLAGNPLVKGVRRIIEFEKDLEFCLQPGFIRGVQLLPRYGLSFDINISHPQMGRVIELVRRCPGVSFILDHLGKPGVREGLLEPWKTDLQKLGEFPNVHCKISGLATEADHDKWAAADLRPYLDHALHCFGINRLCFAGDWPVAEQAVHYPQWVETVLWAFAGCSRDDLEKLFRSNAIHFYRLPE